MSGPEGDSRVLVIPCSGIGKVQGLIAREAAYMVTDQLAEAAADTLCLALLVKGDEEAIGKVQARACVTIDGCGKACARTSVETAGARPAASVQVATFMKAHRGAQPGSAATLKPDGWAIVEDIAGTVAGDVLRMSRKEEAAG